MKTTMMRIFVSTTRSSSTIPTVDTKYTPIRRRFFRRLTFTVQRCSARSYTSLAAAAMPPTGGLGKPRYSGWTRNHLPLNALSPMAISLDGSAVTLLWLTGIGSEFAAGRCCDVQVNMKHMTTTTRALYSMSCRPHGAVRENRVSKIWRTLKPSAALHDASGWASLAAPRFLFAALE